MKEIALYALAACASLFVFGFSIHMLIGGLVSEELETTLIVVACVTAASVMGYMAWDVTKRRRIGK